MSKIVLITGCSSGIGLFTAIEFAKHGDTVFAGLRDLSKKDVLEAEALKANVKVNMIQLDISDDSSINDAIKLKSKLFNENPIALDTMYSASLAYIALIRNKNNPNQTISIKFNGGKLVDQPIITDIDVGAVAP